MPTILTATEKRNHWRRQLLPSLSSPLLSGLLSKVSAKSSLLIMHRHHLPSPSLCSLSSPKKLCFVLCSGLARPSTARLSRAMRGIIEVTLSHPLRLSSESPFPSSAASGTKAPTIGRPSLLRSSFSSMPIAFSDRLSMKSWMQLRPHRWKTRYEKSLRMFLESSPSRNVLSAKWDFPITSICMSPWTGQPRVGEAMILHDRSGKHCGNRIHPSHTALSIPSAVLCLKKTRPSERDANHP